jgi:hypothetical protein
MRCYSKNNSRQAALNLRQKREESRIKAFCINCGKEFRKLNRSKYCSQTCSKAYRSKPKETKNCISCGTEFLASKGYIRCKLCREREKNKGSRESNLFASCSACGDIDWLVIHHKDFNPNNNDPLNLEYICKSCHHIRHRLHKSKHHGWKRKDIARSVLHFNRRYEHFGGLSKLREILNTGWGAQSRAARHFCVSRELVRQWKIMYKDVSIIQLPDCGEQ